MSTVQIGKRIANLRDKQGLTQAEFAQRLGIDPSYISKIEGGHQGPSFKVLKKAAAVLSVSPSYLVASDKEISGVAAYMTEGAEFLAQFQQLSEGDKRSLSDFLRFLLEQKHKKNKFSETFE